MNDIAVAALVATIVYVALYAALFRAAIATAATAKKVAEQLREVDRLIVKAKAKAAVDLRASEAINATYRALAAEQVRLQGVENAQANGISPGNADTTRHRCEGITAAIRVLTDEAGRRGHVIR